MTGGAKPICPPCEKREMTFKEAERAAKRARRREHRAIQAYRCPFGNGWHYGTGHNQRHA
jgi:hypothetical protein